MALFDTGLILLVCSGSACTATCNVTCPHEISRCFLTQGGLNLASWCLVSVQETLKSVVAQYNASQLLTMREVSGQAWLVRSRVCAFQLALPQDLNW